MTDQVGHIIDFLPTFLDVAKTQYPETYQGNAIRPVEGMSLLNVLKTPDKTIARSQPLFWGYAGNRAVRDGDWKLAWDAKLKRWELYNMRSDRTEMHDLANQHPEKVQTLAAAWKTWADTMDVKY
jgi:arylsulfatase